MTRDFPSHENLNQDTNCVHQVACFYYLLESMLVHPLVERLITIRLAPPAVKFLLKVNVIVDVPVGTVRLLGVIVKLGPLSDPVQKVPLRAAELNFVPPPLFQVTVTF